MKSKVKVTGDATGNVVIPSKTNPEWGHIRVEQDRIVTDDRGFARRKKISALIAGTVADLKGFRWKAGQEIEGTIIFREQLTPFNPKDSGRDYKMAGKTGIVCCVYGEPIYRKTFYREDSEAKDVFIIDEHGAVVTHTNGEEIRAAYLKLAEAQETESNMGNM